MAKPSKQALLEARKLALASFRYMSKCSAKGHKIVAEKRARWARAAARRRANPYGR